ncbi:7-cyano-7-deazaguanine synthase QueC [bacterium]|nr:7-cyano-7-deazaguanine synthase QueC [bacterium]
MTKSIVLLSGGLDSLVSLGLKRNELNVSLALTFDYGQKSAQQEIDASKKICEYYGIEHVVIKLDWLKNITQTSLVSDDKIPTGDALNDGNQSMKSVWVPNRNGLFLNIAGSFADSYGYDYILIGANKEEAQTFSDNTQEFIDAINKEFEYSTQNAPKVVAPLINYIKNDIVMLALDSGIPLELTRSCYQGGAKHCGICESCVRLKNSLLANNDQKYIKVLFE